MYGGTVLGKMKDVMPNDESGKEHVPPDIFRAAENNDLEELAFALQSGQRLDHKREPDKMTPVHVAAALGHADFVWVLMEIHPQVAWMRDEMYRRPIEHSNARNDQVSAGYLKDAMFQTPENAP